MPLDKSGSKTAVGRNISTEMAAGKPHAQAVAIALNTQRAVRGAAGGASVNDVYPPRPANFKRRGGTSHSGNTLAVQGEYGHAIPNAKRTDEASLAENQRKRIFTAADGGTVRGTTGRDADDSAKLAPVPSGSTRAEPARGSGSPAWTNSTSDHKLKRAFAALAAAIPAGWRTSGGFQRYPDDVIP